MVNKPCSRFTVKSPCYEFTHGDVVVLVQLSGLDAHYPDKDKYENLFYSFCYEHPLFYGLVYLRDLFSGDIYAFRSPQLKLVIKNGA